MPIVTSHTTLALAEGFGLAFSPCILPILPFILAASTGSRWRPFVVIAGFIASFTGFALVSRKILAVSGIQQDTIQYGAYALLLVFGLTMLIPFIEKHFAGFTNRLANGAQNISSGERAEGLGGALLVGALIGVVWTPCAGPILAAALLQIIQAQTNFDAVMTMTAFSVGAAVPMLAIALFGQQLTGHIRSLSRHATLIRRGMGVVIVGFALLGLFGVNIGAWFAQQESPAAAAAPSPIVQASATQISAPDMAPQDAPEIAGITQWLNSNPLILAQLKGKVVLIDFWTYSCINCIRTLPYVESWYEKYKDQGLVVIGVHTPEFPFEGKPDNVAMAIKKFGITYPVAMDNDFATWKNFHNQYWPAHYLIDANGKIVYTHFGEGHYAETENTIRQLLKLGKTIDVAPDAVVSTPMQTKETYLGRERGQNFASPEGVALDQPQTYTYPPDVTLHHWALQGAWTVGAQRVTADRQGSALKLNFLAGKVYLVLGSKSGKAVHARLTLNGQPLGDAAGKDAPDSVVTIDQQRLYELVNQPVAKTGILEITASEPGLQAYAFTFGN